MTIPAKLKQHKSLAPLTTIGLGGSARYFLAAEDHQTLLVGIRWATGEGLPICFLGGGSNILFADEGWPGLVIQLAMRGWDAVLEGDVARVSVNAGEPWDPFVAQMVANQWAGLECLSGIPGSVGATPIQNVGAYGQEVSETIEWVEVLDLRSLEWRKMSPESCHFGYRTSVFKTELRDQMLVTAVGFRLKVGGAPKVAYRDLQKRVGSEPDLSTVRQTVLAVRREKAMVVDPSEPNSRSCGSFFTNPILDKAAYEAFHARHGDQHPRFIADDGSIKIPAAWLIEQAGFKKGFTYKGVGLSEKHSLALINKGQGTAEQVLTFAGIIREAVFQQYGLVLEPEPVLMSAVGKRLQLAPIHS